MKHFLILTWTAFGLISIPLLGYAAQSGDVIFNEIAWMGSEVPGVEVKNWWRYEWLELYNTKDHPINLDGWTLELAQAKVDWTLKLAGTMPARGYFLIASSDKIANVDLNYAKLDGKFENSGQLVTFKDGDGNIIDQIDARTGNGWAAYGGNNEDKKTMERKSFSGLSGDTQNWGTSLERGGTPRRQNSLTASVPSSPTPTFSPTSTPQPTSLPAQTPLAMQAPTPSYMPSSAATPSPPASSLSSPPYTPPYTPAPLAGAAAFSPVPSVSFVATPQVSRSASPSPFMKISLTPKTKGASVATATNTNSASAAPSPFESNNPVPGGEEDLAVVSGGTRSILLSTGVLLIVVLSTLGVLWKYVIK